MKGHRKGHTLRLAEELSCFREIFKDEEGRCGADNGEKPLEDEYPRPAWLPSDTVHIVYRCCQ